MNQGWTYFNRVNRAAAGQSLLDFYSQRYHHSSRHEWLERIESGQVRLDGKQTHPEVILAQGQLLSYHRPPWQEPQVPLVFDVLYEDTEIFIISKPSGLPVLPGGGFLEHTLLHQVQKQFPQDTPLPIHRLGRGTSGVMLLARSQQARANLSRQMRSRQILKQYRALVGPEQLKCPLDETFEINQAIGKVPYPGWGEVYAANDSGHTAHSICKVLQRRQDSTLLSVQITTGRPHQIRIHLATIGYPLLGDPLYIAGGTLKPLPKKDHSRPVPGDCGYSLHAYSLKFAHPKTNRWMQFISIPPSKLQITSQLSL